MEKFLLVLFLLLKIIIIIVIPVFIFFYQKKQFINKVFYIEIILLISLVISYIFGFSYISDSNVQNIFNLNMMNNSDNSPLNSFKEELSNYYDISEIQSIEKYKSHKNDDIYYYNGYEISISAKKINCDNSYNYFKSYSSMITTTSMLLSSYFQKDIDPIELLNKSIENGLIDCNNPMNKDKFFEMITKEYKVNFEIISNNQLQNYILNGKPVMIETLGKGMLSCKESYYLVYDINNSGNYLLLDPHNKSYEYICPDGSTGFGNVLKANYNEEVFSSSDILSDTNRLIVIGGTR